MTPFERDLAIRTIYGEANGQPEDGIAAVAHVIRNRVGAGTYGPDMRSVIMAPNQFEPWNRDDGRYRMKSLDARSPEYQRIGAIVDRVYGGEAQDPTGGATHFFAPAAQAALGRNVPSWATPETHRATIGGHAFYAPQGARPAGVQAAEAAAAGRRVTDPDMIRRLDALAAPAAPAQPQGRRVTDPDLIRRLDEAATPRPVPVPAPQPQQEPPAAPAAPPQPADDAPMVARVGDAFTDIPIGQAPGAATPRQLRAASDRINAGPARTSIGQRLYITHENMMRGAEQRTSPDPGLYGQPVGSDVGPADDGNMYFRRTGGGTEQVDPRRHVVLLDPNTGRPTVYLRSPAGQGGGNYQVTEEGPIVGASRVFMSGFAAPSTIPRVAAPSALRPGQEAIHAGQRVGVDIPVAVGSDNIGVQQAGNVVRNVPGVGAPVVRAYEDAVQATGRATAGLAEELGGQGREAAGNTVREALRNWHSGPARSTPAGAAQAEARTADAERTAARAVADQFEPARPAPPASAGARTTAVAEVTPGAAPPAGPARSREIVERAYNAVDGAITNPGARTELEATRAAVARIVAQNTSARLPPGAAVGIVQDAITTAGGLTYEGIKRLRTRVGEMIDNPRMRPPNMSQGELRAIYTGLTNDLEVAITASGGARARQLWERANRVNTLVEQRRADLARVIGVRGDAPAEAVYDRLLQAASDRGGANVNLLAQARRSVGTDEWSEFAGAVIGRMGRNPSGEFSPALFQRDYGRLSEAGRVALFGENTPHARALTDINTVSQRLQRFSRFDNPSGTARSASGAAMGGAVVADPITTLSTMLGGNIVSRLLARPAGASSVARWSEAYERAVTRGRDAPRLAAQLEIATRNLANTAGVEYDPAALARVFQPASQ